MLLSPGADDLLDFLSMWQICYSVKGVVLNSSFSPLSGITSLIQCGRPLYVPFAGLTKELE